MIHASGAQVGDVHAGFEIGNLDFLDVAGQNIHLL